MSDQRGTVHADARGVTVATDGTLRSRHDRLLECAACHHTLRARGYHQLGFSPGREALFMSFQTLVAVCEECGRVEFLAVDAGPRQEFDQEDQGR